MESLDGANAAFGKSDPPNAAFAQILVVGAGTMGAQIAMVCALAGHDTTVTDLTDDALARARSALRSRLDRDAGNGRRQEATFAHS